MCVYICVCTAICMQDPIHLYRLCIMNIYVFNLGGICIYNIINIYTSVMNIYTCMLIKSIYGFIYRETCLRSFLEILKQTLQNFKKTLKTCSLRRFIFEDIHRRVWNIQINMFPIICIEVAKPSTVFLCKKI